MSWTRPRHEPSGRKAMIWLVTFGSFSDHPTIDEPVPPGVDVCYHERGQPAFDGWLEPPLGDLLELHPDGIGEIVRSATSAISVVGEVDDAPDMRALRSAIALMTQLIPAGGKVILDPQTFRWRSRREWLELFGEAPGFDWRDHVVILKSDDWLHTRGLRKFARADVSVRGVPSGREDAAADLIERLIVRQIEGTLPEKLGELLPPHVRLVPHLSPLDIDDPAFDNVRVELEGFR